MNQQPNEQNSLQPTAAAPFCFHSFPVILRSLVSSEPGLRAAVAERGLCKRNSARAIVPHLSLGPADPYTMVPESNRHGPKAPPGARIGTANRAEQYGQARSGPTRKRYNAASNQLYGVLFNR
jgi:hypothetical protein